MTDQTTQTQGGQSGFDPVAAALAALPLDQLVTKSGKKIGDFQIPEKLKTDDPAMIDLVMRSEAMDDAERQYWFNLTDVMTPDQLEKLRGILTRERRKLAEIHVKYGKKPPMDPALAAEQAKSKAEERVRQQQELKAREAAEKAVEGGDELLSGDAWS